MYRKLNLSVVLLPSDSYSENLSSDFLSEDEYSSFCVPLGDEKELGCLANFVIIYPGQTVAEAQKVWSTHYPTEICNFYRKLVCYEN